MIPIALNASKMISLKFKALFKCRRIPVPNSWCKRRMVSRIEGPWKEVWKDWGRALGRGQTPRREGGLRAVAHVWCGRIKESSKWREDRIWASLQSASYCSSRLLCSLNRTRIPFKICTFYLHGRRLFHSPPPSGRGAHSDRDAVLYVCAFDRKEVHLQRNKPSSVQHFLGLFTCIFPGGRVVYICTLLG